MILACRALFVQLQASGSLSRSPIADSVLAVENRRPMLLALALGIPMFRAAGYWSDRSGRLQPMLLGMAVAALSCLPGFQLLMTYSDSPVILTLAILGMIVGAALTCGPGAAYLAELFPTRIRYTSLSFPYHITSAWFGGFMPLTATWRQAL